MATTFTIKYSNTDKQSFTIAPYTANGYVSPTDATFIDGAVRADTTLKLYGKGMQNYGEGKEQNLLYLLENFANFDAPNVAIEGQLWYKTPNAANPSTLRELFVRNGSSGWDAVITANGNSPMTGELDMGGIGSPVSGSRIINLADGVNPQDAATLSQLTTLGAGKLNIDGTNAMQADLDMAGASPVSNKIINLADPTLATDALTLGFADARFVNINGDAMTGDLNMGNTNSITGIADPVASRDAVNLQYADATYVNTNGDTMTGLLVLSGNPTVAMGAATKQYVDSVATGIIAGDTYLRSGVFSLVGSPGVPTLSLTVSNLGGSPEYSNTINITGMADVNHIHTASEIVNVPAGSILSSNVQSALNELDVKKLTAINPSLSGPTNSFSLIGGSSLLLDHEPILGHEAATKTYVDNQVAAATPAGPSGLTETTILRDVQATTGAATYTMLDVVYLVGSEKLSVFVNGLKSITNTRGYQKITFATPDPLFPGSNSGLAATDPTPIGSPEAIPAPLYTYTFNVTVDGVGPYLITISPYYDVLPSTGSPTTPGFYTYEALAADINAELIGSPYINATFSMTLDSYKMVSNQNTSASAISITDVDLFSSISGGASGAATIQSAVPGVVYDYEEVGTGTSNQITFEPGSIPPSGNTVEFVIIGQ